MRPTVGFLCALASVPLALTGCSPQAGDQPAGPPPAGTPSSADVVERASPSVVTIQAPDGQGSGVVLRPDIVVTNQHVVAGTRNLTIAFADGSMSPGTVLAADAVADVAVVRSQRGGLPVPQFRSELPRPGESSLAIGSPLGYENSVTSGIISGLHRQIPGSPPEAQSATDLIQTDASVSPGNSGGALIDAAGKVAGINEAYLPPSTGAVSLSFAIPTATMLDTADQLLAHGSAVHPVLGLSLVPLTDEIRGRLGVPADHGALVTGVDPGGPGGPAGIAPGDVILRADGKPVRTVDELLALVRTYKPGQQMRLTLSRSGQQVDAVLTVGSIKG